MCTSCVANDVPAPHLFLASTLRALAQEQNCALAKTFCPAEGCDVLVEAPLGDATQRDSGALVCPSCVRRAVVPPFTFDLSLCRAEWNRHVTSALREGRDAFVDASLICEFENGEVALGEILVPAIFASYSWGGRKEDGTFETQGLVVEVKAALEEVLQTCVWLDIERMGGGQEFADEMVKGIERCRAVLVFLDRNYVSSRNCLKELSYAIHFGKTVIVVVIDEEGAAGWWPEEVKVVDEIFGLSSAAMTDRLMSLRDKALRNRDRTPARIAQRVAAYYNTVCAKK
jgi:hypothetical protein